MEATKTNRKVHFAPVVMLLLLLALVVAMVVLVLVLLALADRGDCSFRASMCRWSADVLSVVATSAACDPGHVALSIAVVAQ